MCLKGLLHTKKRRIVCDVCGEKISMADGDKIPVHSTWMGSQWVHPAHALWGFPLPKEETCITP